nr:hypothetical protein [Tanacetum cinerariifolium]
RKDRLKSLEANFSEYIQTNPFAEAVSNISDTVILKRRRDDDDDQEEGPSAGSDWGSKRRREGKEPESASAPLETATRSAGRSTTGSKSRQVSASESAFVEEPVHTIYQMEKPSYLVFETEQDLASCPRKHSNMVSEVAKQVDSRSSFNELLDTPLDLSNFIMHRLRVDTLTPELLTGPTYELMKGSCTSLIELEYHLEEVYKATTDQLDWVNPKGQQYPHNLLQPLPLIPDNRGRPRSLCNSLCTLHQQRPRVSSGSYKHLDWITVRRDDDKLYKFKEGDFKRLRLQDIKDMLLLLVQGKLSNLAVEERFAFNVSLRMFTRSIVIQRRVEDLQLELKDTRRDSTLLSQIRTGPI